MKQTRTLGLLFSGRAFVVLTFMHEMFMDGKFFIGQLIAVHLRLEAWLEERVRLHGAKRTAVDPKDLEMPSRAIIMRLRTWVPAIEI